MFGTVAMGLAATAVGLPTLTSCSGKKSRRVILYFTGTGNSLYIARQLADENTELLSIPQLMRSGKFDIEADEIGIVYPIYGHMPPNMVRRFIQKANLKADYKFAVLTIRFAKLEDDPLLSRGELNPDARYRNENVSLADLRAANSQHR